MIHFLFTKTPTLSKIYNKVKISQQIQIQKYVKIKLLLLMKASKEILSKKQITKFSITGSPVIKHKSLSKSISKSAKYMDMDTPIKKGKDGQLKIIKQVIKKKKQQKKTDKKQEKKQQKKSKKEQSKKQQKKQEKKKKVNYCLNLKQLKPVNLQKQKQLFFTNNYNYNPFFIYPNISDLNDQQYKDAKRYDTADDSLIGLALAILQKCQNLDYHNLMKQSPILDIEQVSVYFDNYIKNLDAINLLTYQFVENTIAPTSVIHNNSDGMSRVMISLPIKYRQHTIEGVLNHQIGTHFIRKHNDRLQKWHKDRKKYGISPYLTTQQGLASLNQLVSYVMNQSFPPLLYRAALLYYCSYLASKCSFAQIFKAITKYQPDPQTRWKQCVRVKRGIADTSKPNGMYKDQIYFLGAVQVLRNRKKLNMYHLHSGKITVQDCLKLSQKKQINQQKLKLPYFLNDIKAYNQCLDIIAEANMIHLVKQ